MLAYLRIKNLAVIDDVALELGPGLTVFTGETGAGKSIILDGLALALGERASLDQVRAGAERAVVEAAFAAPRDPDLLALLEEAELAAADGSIVVRRVLTSVASRAYINDQLVGLQKLKAVGDRLVDLHGQHEHQSLLAAAAHRELLDRYGDLLADRDRVSAAFEEAVAVGEALGSVSMDERDRAQRVDLLRFQVEEIDAAALRSGEDEDLEREQRRLAHAEELVGLGGGLVALLYEAEGSAASLLARAERDLDRLQQFDPEAPGELEAVSSARFAAEETARSLQQYVDGLEVDPKRLDEVDRRMSLLRGLERKYGEGIERIVEYASAARRELDALEHHDEKLAELEADLERAVKAYSKTAAKLGKARRQAAGALEKEVVDELARLGMESATFEVAIASLRRGAPEGLPAGASRWGNDLVEFRLAANPGEAPGPLNKVASGGELSRVMLSLKLAASGDPAGRAGGGRVGGDPIETLVFDEVDSGIGGGRVAEHLAQRLALLGKSHQVLVVTHLPQVAAYADTHIGIRKLDTSEGRVSVEARQLDQGEQVDELARILGGLEVTDATREHAREMLAARG